MENFPAKKLTRIGGTPTPLNGKNPLNSIWQAPKSVWLQTVSLISHSLKQYRDIAGIVIFHPWPMIVNFQIWRNSYSEYNYSSSYFKNTNVVNGPSSEISQISRMAICDWGSHHVKKCIFFNIVQKGAGGFLIKVANSLRPFGIKLKGNNDETTNQWNWWSWW